MFPSSFHHVRFVVAALPGLLGCIPTVGCFPELSPVDGVVAPLDGGSERNGSAVGETVTVATYNVENFDLGGTEAPQYAHVARFAKEEGVDVLVLQEVQKDAAGDDEAAFGSALEAVSYPMGQRLFSNMSDGFNAIGVWSRFPVSEVAEILPENTRTVLRFRIEVAGHSLWFYGCHLKSGSDQVARETRRTEAARLAAYIVGNHDPAAESLFVLGDMNTGSAGDFGEEGTLSYLTLTFDDHTTNDSTAVNHTELSETWTYPAGQSLLDHIILSPPALSRYVPASVRIPAPEGDGAYGPSDHLPVVLDVIYRE